MSTKTNRLLCRVATLGIATVLAGAGIARAESPAPLARPATLPSTMPSTPNPKALVQQLGADDFKQREAAAEQLRKLGKDALPALKDATTSTDPEVQARALALIHDLEHKDDKPPVAETPLNGIGEVRMNGQRFQIRQGGLIGPGGAGAAGGFVVGGNGNITIHVTSVMTVNGNQTSDSTVRINNSTYKLHTDADGLKLSVTEGGQTKEYAAKDADDLKKKEPEAYKIYEKNFGQNAAGAGTIEIKPVPER